MNTNDTTDTRKRTVKLDGQVLLSGECIGRVIPTFPGYMTEDENGSRDPYMFWRKRSDAVEFLVHRFDRQAAYPIRVAGGITDTRKEVIRARIRAAVLTTDLDISAVTSVDSVLLTDTTAKVYVHMANTNGAAQPLPAVLTITV